MFHNLNLDDRAALQDFFREKRFDICLNYPDQALSLPAIVITLKSETEATTVLGNLLQDPSSIASLGMPFMVDELRGVQTVVGAGSAGSASQPGNLLKINPVLALGGTASTVLLPPGSSGGMTDPFEEPVYAQIIEGTGAGQERLVDWMAPHAVTGNVIVAVTENWTTIPDTTSVARVVSKSYEVTGEMPKIFKSTDVLRRRGAHYQANYQILVITEQQEKTIFVYNVVKAILFANQDFLIRQGFMNLSMSGTDFAPRSEYYPTTAYQRALNLTFEYAFDVFDVVLDEILINTIKVAVGVHTPDMLNADDREDGVAVVTEFDLT
jgi:hypothetical protein